jgi:hypothetical protein
MKSITERIKSERKKPRKTFVAKPTGKTAFRRPKTSFQENTETDPNQTGCEMVLDVSLCSPVGRLDSTPKNPRRLLKGRRYILIS